MTNLPFVVNGEDFSDVVHKYGYSTDSIPVYSRTVTTLDKRDHQVIVRHRGVLTITLNPIKKERAAQFGNALRALPATVRYHCFQTGRDVSQQMRAVDGLPLSLIMQNAGVDWLDQTQITFEEL